MKCPNCNKEHYIEKYSTRTMKYFPPIYQNGVNINPDGNTTTVYCTCYECNHNFHYTHIHGEIQDVVDDGAAPVPKSFHVPEAPAPKGEPIQFVTRQEAQKLQEQINGLANEIHDLRKELWRTEHPGEWYDY